MKGRGIVPLIGLGLEAAALLAVIGASTVLLIALLYGFQSEQDVAPEIFLAVLGAWVILIQSRIVRGSPRLAGDTVEILTRTNFRKTVKPLADLRIVAVGREKGLFMFVFEDGLRTQTMIWFERIGSRSWTKRLAKIEAEVTRLAASLGLEVVIFEEVKAGRQTLPPFPEKKEPSSSQTAWVKPDLLEVTLVGGFLVIVLGVFLLRPF